MLDIKKSLNPLHYISAHKERSGGIELLHSIPLKDKCKGKQIIYFDKMELTFKSSAGSQKLNLFVLAKPIWLFS